MCTLPVSYIFDFLACQFTCYRHIHESNPDHTVSDFSLATSTSNLRKHLYNEHLEQWVTSCDNLGIEITAQAALPFVKKFLQEPADTPLESERPKYSKEAFVENIVLAGDQHQWAVISKCIESENYRSGLHKSAGDVWCLCTSKHLNAMTCSAGDVLHQQAFTTQLQGCNYFCTWHALCTLYYQL